LSASFFTGIDWSRVAEPQDDQYDTKIILELAGRTTSAERPEFYRRTAVGTAPAVFDGAVAVRYVYHSVPEFAPLAEQYPDAPVNHPNISAAVEYVRRWPTAFKQVQQLLEAIHPAQHPDMPLESEEIYRGSLCHSYERLFGTMWATIFCPIGLAEAIVHEVAHQKLRVLGVSLESAARVVGNDPADLYLSPIIKERLRPLTAVLHAEYSYVHVTALDIHMLNGESNAARRAGLAEVLETNLARIEEGYGTLQQHFKAGEHGEEFMAAFLAWTERIMDDARHLLSHAPGAGKSKRTGPVKEAHSGPPDLMNLLSARAPVVFAYNGGIGDRLCNLPALRALDALFPNRLTLICGEGDRDLYYSDLKLRAVHELDLQLCEVGFTFDAGAVARHMVDCDLFISINPWHTSSVSDLLGEFSDLTSIGFFPEFRHQLPCDYAGHAMDMAFAIPHFLHRELNLFDFSNPPAISETASAIARDFRKSYANWERVIFVHTDTKSEKSWPADRFEQVLDRFLQEFPGVGALVVDVRGEGIRRGRFPDRILPVTLPLDACFGLLRDAELFLGVDSCHLHAADLFRVPGVGLFGPTTSRRWGYKFSNYRHLQASKMEEITVDDVYEALCSLARHPQAQSEGVARASRP
jgi:ADP-heptose:LPS heptosyltransferase